MRFRQSAAIAILFFPLLTWLIPVTAQEQTGDIAAVPEQAPPLPVLSDVELEIRNHDRKIFLDLVKLAEFNVRFQQTVNHRARWRSIAYPLAQEAGYAGFFAYSLSDLSQRARGWNSPARISPTSTKRALASATVGPLLGASSSLLELGANGFESIRTNKRGFSSRQALAFVQSTVKQVDENLARRHALMEASELTGTRRELLDLKEQVLKYERDRLVFEFKRWSAHSRGYTWYQNTFYLINATVNMGRFSAVQLGFKSFTQPKCSGATGPILIASAFIAGLGPLASSTVGNCMQSYQERSLSKKLPVAPFLTDEEAKKKFERLAEVLATDETTKQNAKLSSELIRLREEKLGLDALILSQENKINRFRRVAGQQAITAPAISSFGVASATLSTIAYHAYRQQKVINNKLGFAGDASIIPAEVVALIATPAASIKGYLYERDLKRKGEHPDQLLLRRQRDLESLEKMVSDAWR